jgi:hypothetical protein
MNLVALRIIACFISTDGTTVAASRGCSPVHTSTGLWTVTLDQEVDADQMLAVATVGTDARYPRVASTSDSVKTVTIDDVASAVADAAVMVIFYAIPPAA